MPRAESQRDPYTRVLTLPVGALIAPAEGHGAAGDGWAEALAPDGRPPRLVLGFVPPRLDFARVAAAVRAALPPQTALVLTSSAGTLCAGRRGGLYDPEGEESDRVVLQAFGADLLRAVSVHAIPLHCQDIRSGAVAMGHDRRIEAIRAELEVVAPPFELDCHDTVALALVDGLSASESHFMEAVYASGRFPLLFVGGSAGGTQDFTDTWIFDGRRVLRDHAVVAFVKLAPGIHYGVLKSQNFRKTGVSFTILDADPLHRTVASVIDPGTLEVRGFVDALCATLRCGREELDSRLVERTFAVELDGQLYVRSVARIDAGTGTASFFCDVTPGDELHLVEATDFIGQTAADAAAFLAGKPPPVAGILFDCALRRRNNAPHLAGLTVFDGLPAAGFSTFGELSGLHVNQTLTAVFFFAGGDGAAFGAGRFPVEYAAYRSYFTTARQTRLGMLNRLRQRLIQTLLDRGEAAAPLYGRVEHLTVCAERASADEPDNLSEAVVELLGAVRHARREHEAAAAALSLREEELRLAEERRQAAEMRVELEARLRRAQKLEALSCLAGGMAHEINNMLQPILGLTELVMEDVPADGPIHRNLACVVDAAKRAHGITSRVLRFSRADEGTTALALSLPATVRGARAIVDLLVPRGVTIDWRIAADDAVVLADETQLIQVLINLVRNAADATAGEGVSGRGGRIGVAVDTLRCEAVVQDGRTFDAGIHAVLSVSDHGCGMDAATVERMFDPFFTTKAVGSGTGLGLAMVHGIVVDWGGRIAVESAVGRGTTVSVILPLAAERDGAEDDGLYAFGRG